MSDNKRYAEQDQIFEWYFQMSKHFGREPDPWHIHDLANVFPENQVIEVWIAMFGGNQIHWQYQHIDRVMKAMIVAYGAKLIPFLKIRHQHPLHGGGTAYGGPYLDAHKERVKLFCERALGKLSEQ